LKNKKKDKLVSNIKIKLTFDDSHIAQAIDKATNPENLETPEQVSAQSTVEGNEVHLTVEAKSTLQDLLTTVEDYLEKIDLSYKTIKSLKEKEK
jgi:tRNA threonylcarbamoyladenosine modification (KEOPS) complex  Pcc1 subunit